MNEYDSNRISDLVKKIGYSKTKNEIDADCYVLNTCHIREKSTEKVYDQVGRIRKAYKSNKKPILLVTGCVAQAEGEEMLKREKYIDGVIGPQSYHKITDIIKRLEIKKDRINSTDFEVIEKFDKINLTKNNNSEVSSFISIQEGCDKFCHFCVVPYTRGPEYSRPPSEIISEAQQLITNGSKEITLLGQNVNSYKSGNYKLSDLIKELSYCKGLERIRYTTSHPRDMTEDLIEVHKNIEKLMPLLHLPVQSGSSKILKLMNRKHNIEEFLDIMTKLKKVKPSIQFSSDFIIGYPGESEEDFNKTLSLMKKIKFINSFSYIFSPRPGTPASGLDNIDKETSKKRLQLFQKISDDIKKKYKSKLVNQKVKVLFENKLADQKKYFGRDEHLNSVIVSSEEDIVGKVLDVKIHDYNLNTLFGKIYNSYKKRNVAA